VGEDAFRAGVRTYIKKHAYSNAVTDDLWAEIDKASPLPVSEIAHDFTLQAGVPLILAEKASGGAKLSQERFAVDDTSQIAQTWHQLGQRLNSWLILKALFARVVASRRH